MEKETGKKVKDLKSDNGGDYMSSDFKNFNAKEGIRRDLTTPHNPQQNGVAKRKNCNIVGETRVMLHDQSLPFHLWDKSCNTTFYLQKKIPHRILYMITLEEYFSRMKSNVSYFRIFGLYLLSCLQRIKEEARANNKIEGICGLQRNSPQLPCYIPRGGNMGYRGRYPR